MKRTKSRKQTKTSGAKARPKPSGVPMVRAQQVQPPTFRSSLPYFAALILAAVVWYYAWPFVILAAIVAVPLLLLAWLEPRYPRTAFIFYGFLSGLISGIFGSRGYYRRHWW